MRLSRYAALGALRQLEAGKRRGELLDADAVARQWQDVLRRVRAGIMAVPSRLRARLPHLTARDVEVLDRELRHALAALAEEPKEQARVPRPRLKQNVTRHPSPRIAQRECDHDDIVKRTNDRQELGDQIDG